MQFSTQTPKQMIQALFNAKSNFKKLTKNAKGYNYTYANLENVIDAVEESLSEQGLMVTQEAKKSPYESDKFIQVLTTVCHVESGSTVSTELVIPVKVADPQGFGSAFTYGRRYALLGLFGLVAEDDDGNATLSQVIEKKEAEKDERKRERIRERIREETVSEAVTEEKTEPVLETKPEPVAEKQTVPEPIAETVEPKKDRVRSRPTTEERKPIENTEYTIDRSQPKTETASGQQPIIPEELKEIKLDEEPIDINKKVTVDEYSEEQYSNDEVETVSEPAPVVEETTTEPKRTRGRGQK